MLAGADAPAVDRLRKFIEGLARPERHAGISRGPHAPSRLLRETRTRNRPASKRAGFRDLAAEIRFEGKGRDYVQLIASVAPPSASMAKIRKELEEGVDGSTEDLVEELSAPVALVGLGACGKDPVVLLYGLVHERVGTAVLISRGHDQPFERAAIPSELGANGVLGYGFLTAPATLKIRSPAGALVYSQQYPGPQPSGDWAAGSTSSLVYLFGKK
jgi:hypothetical protein